MNNDYLKQELIKAKEAIIKSDEKKNSDSSDTLQLIEGVTKTEFNVHLEIMNRVSKLMEDAEIINQEKDLSRLQNKTNDKKNDSVGQKTKKPFWSQEYDLSPSEQFKKKKKMQEQKTEDALKDEEKLEENNESIEADDLQQMDNSNQEENVVSGQEITDNDSNKKALDDIKSEVIGKISESMPDTDLIKKSLSSAHDRLDDIEPQILKHQKDINALLKLVRDLSKKQSELGIIKTDTPPKKSNFWTFIFSIMLLSTGIIGWLYWLNPSKMNLIMNNFSNDVLENIYKLVTLIS